MYLYYSYFKKNYFLLSKFFINFGGLFGFRYESVHPIFMFVFWSWTCTDSLIMEFLFISYLIYIYYNYLYFYF